MAWSRFASTTGRVMCAALSLAIVAACGDDAPAPVGATGGEGSTEIDPGSDAGTSPGATESEGGSSSTVTTSDATSDATSEGTRGELPDLDAICHDLLGRNADAVAGLCECDVASGLWPDVAACLAANGVHPDTVDCECAVLAGYPALAPGFLCLLGAADAYLECVAPYTCASTLAREACLDAYAEASASCPALGDNVAAGQVEIVCEGASPFLCADGGQVPETWTCDLELDCADGSDELGCPSFPCASGESIPEPWRCDGFDDCVDASDEVGCPTFTCADGEVVPIEWRCDGYFDCADMSDEDGCPTFTCTSGETIPESWRCDGENDCADDSDELGCD